jgi:hypothetical protein
LRDAATDLRGRDLGVALRVASGIALGEEAGGDEARNGEH